MNNVAVIGLGKSGVAAMKLLIRKGYNVYVYDDNETQLNKYINTFNVGILTADNTDGLQFAVISPGVSDDNKIIVELSDKNIKIISELELGYLNTESDIIAITGTNGKTSTTTLIAEFLNSSYINAYPLGNIGTPLCEKAEALVKSDVAVVETSSFQLKHTEKFKPHIAIILNVTCDHIDRHKTFEDYIESKARIFINQTSKDYAILNYDEKILKASKDIASHKIYFSSNRILNSGYYVKNNEIYYANKGKEIYICDVADIENTCTDNALALLAVCGILNLPYSVAINTIKKFKPAKYTVEKIYDKNGLKIFNDSKGTNTAATINAVNRMRGETVLIMGGREKGEKYADFFKTVRDKIKHFVFFGENAEALREVALNNGVMHFTVCKTLEDAFFAAKSEISVGNILFSPACASFDQFKNYAERGNAFEKIVKKFYEE